MFRRVLVANRGEIAVRIIRALREMGIESVAVHSAADAHALHVLRADTAVAVRGYLDIESVVEAALRSGAQAVHPGYGFLSENAAFARVCVAAGLTFVGPSAEAIALMGDKIAAKATVSAHGVATIPGTATDSGRLSDDELIAAAADIGFPILVKPAVGGGGKGMRRVERTEELPAALASARRESAALFGDDTLFLERYLATPRHIEVQVLADDYGHVVHLGERECSLQRRHQKVIEESPSPLFAGVPRGEAVRARIGAAACAVARSVDYRGAGTVEFLVSRDEPDRFYFMEMNTRLQVEHPVTELVTGIDLVHWQIRIAAGEKLDLAQEDVCLAGHAVQARVYAEDPGRGFLPTGGTVLDLALPDETDGVRLDFGLQVGDEVDTDYDPMLGKVVVWAGDRAQALRRLDSALAATAIPGIVANIAFLRTLAGDPDVVAGSMDTGLVDRLAETWTAPVPDPATVVAAAAYHRLRSAAQPVSAWDLADGWRLGAHAPIRLFGVELVGTPDDAEVSIDGAVQRMSAWLHGGGVVLSLNGVTTRHRAWPAGGADVWITDAAGVLHVLREQRAEGSGGSGGSNFDAGAQLRSPMPGTVIAVPAASGDTVAAGRPLVVVEAMKMEHTLAAPVSGLARVMVAVGDRVTLDQIVAEIEQTNEAGGRG
jgi:acetyl-CoA/propionyl-CoA carboxylase biotin carboxyl carrier protein